MKIFRTKWFLPVSVFLPVLAIQLWLVAAIGTDIPFQDQWDVEGHWLYPAALDGTLRPSDLLRPVNEHRAVWTHLLNLGLFFADGAQWDPLVQLAVLALMRGACAAGIAWIIGAQFQWRGRLATSVGMIVAFLPHLAWSTVLWGGTSHAYFLIGFATLTFVLLGPAARSAGRTLAGLLTGTAALLSMGSGVFVPVALLGLSALRAVERRRCDFAWWREAWPALALLAAGWAWHVTVPAHTGLHAATVGQFLTTFARALAWPHIGMPLAAVALNLPLLIAVVGRCLHRREAAPGEDFVLLMGGMAVATAAAMGWVRGGGNEFDAGVPSRYVDYLVLLPIANTWCAITLAQEIEVPRRRLAQVLAGAWGVFLFVGWLGLSAQVIRGLVLPRMRDRDAPVRLAVAFQHSGDAHVFAGQPLLFVPHPNPESVRRVLNDPVMRGKLPPSLQTGPRMGPLSRAVRVLLRREGVSP